MRKLTAVVFLVAVAVVTQSVESKDKSKKKKAPVSVDDNSFSEKEHFHEGKHDSQYDHDAFLGEDQAKEMKSMSPKETKKRLRALFVKVDVDGDKKISRKELLEWIEDNMKKHVAKNTKLRMKEVDKNKDGKVSWDEYEDEEYKTPIEKEEDRKMIEEMKTRDQKRFKVADSNDDKLLDEEELAVFLHPEESQRMTSLLVQENLDILDKDGDGKVNFEEYFGTGHSKDILEDKETMNSLKDNFNKDLDKNKDGFLDQDEVRDWILPGSDTDPAAGEADHLMKEADLDKDNFLTADEIVRHHELFSGSRMTAYGELLKEKGEL